MTVEELIARLGEFPPDMRVVVGGFDEAGYDDPEQPHMILIERLSATDGHIGRYADATLADTSFSAVLIDFRTS